MKLLGSVKTTGSFSSTKSAAQGRTLTLPASGSKAKNLNGISLDIDAKTIGDLDEYSYSIKYSVLGASGAWTSWCSDGTKLSSATFSAVKIKLAGNVKADFTLYYRVYVEGLGWTAWVSGGAVGSKGAGLGVRSVQVQILPASATFSKSISGVACYDASSLATLKYAAANSGNMKAYVKAGKTAGTVLKKSAMTEMRAKVVSGYAGSIKYRARQKNGSWTSWEANGETAGEGWRNFTGMQIKLTGELSDYFDVYYRVYVAGYGWMGWAKNGQLAGSKLKTVKVTAYQVVLTLKGGTVPGITDNHSSTSTGVLQYINAKTTMVKKAQQYSSSSKYLILTDCTANVVCIFQGKKGEWSLIKCWRCTTGASSSPTKKGSFTIGARGLHFGEEKGYTCWYYTQFSGNYLFHSVLYYVGSKTKIKSGVLGVNASHGCVRLALANAKWIYDNIPRGTRVIVY